MDPLLTPAHHLVPEQTERPSRTNVSMSVSTLVSSSSSSQSEIKPFFLTTGWWEHNSGNKYIVKCKITLKWNNWKKLLLLTGEMKKKKSIHQFTCSACTEGGGGVAQGVKTAAENTSVCSSIKKREIVPNFTNWSVLRPLYGNEDRVFQPCLIPQ